MKLVIISECPLREWIVVQEVIHHFRSVTVVQPTYPKNFKNSIVRYGTFSKFGLKVFKKILKYRLRRNLKEEFYKNLEYERIQIPSSELNKERGIKLLTELAPDILFTCWAPLLKKKLISIPKLAAINVHFGIAPDYRGQDTLFWALYNRDFQKIGGCIHYLSKGVDDGSLLAAGYPALNPNDGELELDIKTAKLMAKTAVEVLHKLQQKSPLPLGKTQKKNGRNFRSVQRTLGVNLKYILKRAIGELKPPVSNERVEFYI